MDSLLQTTSSSIEAPLSSTSSFFPVCNLLYGLSIVDVLFVLSQFSSVGCVSLSLFSLDQFNGVATDCMTESIESRDFLVYLQPSALRLSLVQPAQQIVGEIREAL